MTTKIKTWQIVDRELKSVDSSLSEQNRTETNDLETWIASDPAIINPDLVIIGRQVTTNSGKLDLLAIDRAGNLVIIELKRDMLPRDALAQAIDYASDISEWPIVKIDEVCQKYTDNSLENVLNEKFTDEIIENMRINETQRIVLVGFGIESSLERMIKWLSEQYDVNINAVILNYVMTRSGDELLTQTSIISEELELAKIKKKKKFQIPMSDEPGNYDEDTLKQKLKNYLTQNLYSARRIRDVLLPVCVENISITREKLKEEIVNRDETSDPSNVGNNVSLISGQMGYKKNDFLRQVISYEYPKYPWEKDNYQIREEYKELVRTLLKDLKNSEET